MALMFQRIAQNYIKDGYFPTDSDTIGRILSALAPNGQGAMKIIDPCAGEGTALAECRHHLGADKTEAYAVEYDRVRANQAKKLVDRCIHGDFFDQVVSKRSFGLLFLNPPYGNLVSDQGHTAENRKAGSKRLEKKFFQQAIQLLQFGGILALIVPYPVLDDEFQHWLASHLDRVGVYLAPEQRFKQAVVLGVKRRVDVVGATYQQSLRTLKAFSGLDIKPTLPQTWDSLPYSVPESRPSEQFKFQCARLDLEQLAEEIDRFPCLWPQFDTYFGSIGHRLHRPLMNLSDWHLALVLAAGQVAGIVRSNDGMRTLVVKGDTFKDKKETVQVEEDGDQTKEVRVVLDVFVPVIKALDFTEGSPTFGKVITIR